MSTAQERLQQGYYNSAAVSGANPGGLASGGHVPNFPAALQDMGVVAQDVGAKAAAAVAGAQSAGQSAAAAHDDRVLAQQAAQAAGQFDPSAYVQKTGGDMTGSLRVGSVLSVRAQAPADGEGGEMVLEAPQGYPEIRIDNYKGRLRAYNLSGWQNWLDYDGVNLMIGVNKVFHPGNDGSGSGLDADMVRGVIPHHEANPSTMVTRDGNGYSHCRGYVIEPGAGENIYWGSIDGGIKRDGTGLRCDKTMYFDSWISASEVRQRSDRRLKTDIEPLVGPLGRLTPVRYVLTATGEVMVGFIAQDVEAVRKEAVREGSSEAAQIPGERPLLELDAMALIAHLTAQVNALQDRLDAAGI